MKTKVLIFLTCLTGAALCIAQTIQVRLPRQNFYAGTSSYTDTTNSLCPVVPLSGYYYPSNFIGVTRWSFDSDIITSTNPIINLKFLTTNISTVITGVYRLTLYTNDANAPYYDSTEVTLPNTTISANTNVMQVRITNSIPVNSVINRSNIIHGSVYFKNSTVNTNWYSSWLIGGSIQFQ